MKSKIILIVFLFGFTNCFGQDLVPDDINDTIKVNKLMVDISKTADLSKAYKLNNIFLKNCSKKLKIKNLQKEYKIFYEKSYLTAILTKAYHEEEKGQVKKSTKLRISVLKYAEKVKYDFIIGSANEALGTTFALAEEYEKAKQYYLNALLFIKKDKNKELEVRTCANLAFVYVKLNNRKEANILLRKCLSLYKELDDEGGVASCLNGLANDCFQNKDYIASRFYRKQSLKYFTAVDDYASLANIYKNLYLIEKELSSNDLALQYLLKARHFAIKSNNIASSFETNKLLSNFFKKNKEFEKALSYLEESNIFKDKNSIENNKNELLKAEFKYETEKKEAQIKSLSQQKKIANLESQRQKTFTLVLAIAIISLLFLAYFLFNRYKIEKQNELLKSQLIEAEKTIEAEKKATESELKALKSQMNPHFIFNALSSIQDQFMYGDKVIANEQMGNFTYLTRQILNVSGKKQILLSTEIDILSKYLELEKMRFKTDFSFTITTSENIDEDYHEIPPMLIQPFVENSIKHGLLHKNGFKKVSINFELDSNEEYIICTVIDNGIGRQKSAEIKAKNQNNHLSFSTASIEQRLELLNDNLKLKHLVVYEDVVENEIIVGTKVVVNIPLV